MKRITLLIAVMALYTVAAFAGPFGLSMGMTLKQITEACGGIEPERIEDDDRYFISPKKKHSLFDTYIAWVDDEYGLYYLKAITEDIPTTEYGIEVQTRFNNLLKTLSKTYGIAEVIDEIDDPDNLWSGNNYWMYSLHRKIRTLSAWWNKENTNCRLSDELTCIFLYAGDLPPEWTGYLAIEYEFANQQKIIEREDSLL